MWESIARPMQASRLGMRSTGGDQNRTLGTAMKPGCERAVQVAPSCLDCPALFAIQLCIAMLKAARDYARSARLAAFSAKCTSSGPGWVCECLVDSGIDL